MSFVTVIELESELTHDPHCLGMETLSLLLEFLVPLDESRIGIALRGPDISFTFVQDRSLGFHLLDTADNSLVAISQHR